MSSLSQASTSLTPSITTMATTMAGTTAKTDTCCPCIPRDDCKLGIAIGVTFFLTLVVTALICIIVFYLYLKVKRQKQREKDDSTSETVEGVIVAPTNEPVASDKKELIKPQVDNVVGQTNSIVVTTDDDYVVPISPKVLVEETNQATAKEQDTSITQTRIEAKPSGETTKPAKRPKSVGDLNEKKDKKQINSDEKGDVKTTKKKDKNENKKRKDSDKDTMVSSDVVDKGKAEANVADATMDDDVDGAIYDNIDDDESPAAHQDVPTEMIKRQSLPGDEMSANVTKKNLKKEDNKSDKKDLQKKEKKAVLSDDKKKQKQKIDAVDEKRDLKKSEKRKSMPEYKNVTAPVHKRPSSVIIPPPLQDKVYTPLYVNESAIEESVYIEPVPSPSDEPTTANDVYEDLYDYADDNPAIKNIVIPKKARVGDNDEQTVQKPAIPAPRKLKHPSIFTEETRDNTKKSIDKGEIQSVNVMSLITDYKKMDEERQVKIYKGDGNPV
ncbi:uncharacterized protein LOC144438779 [Glandiceps talaboti]